MAVARKIIGIVLCVFLEVCNVTANKRMMRKRTTLYNLLSEDYQKDLIPEGIDGGPVVVKHSVNLQRIVSLDDNVLVLDAWLFMGWHDSRLEWRIQNRILGGDVTKKQLMLPISSIWQPDIMLLNNAADYTGTSRGNVNAVISSDGNVTFVSPQITKTFCSVDNGNLYIDNEVTCTLKFSSWSFSLRSMDLDIDKEGLDMGGFDDTFNKQWKYVSSTVERFESTYDCCPDEIYPTLEYRLTFKRVG